VDEPFEYRFEWDSAKAGSNAKKHGITFERAATIFLDPSAKSLFDTEHSAKEERWITLGLDRPGILIVVSHTYLEESKSIAIIRIISARKATKKETKDYERR
jgi:uncharacterized DUF497 family protein